MKEITFDDFLAVELRVGTIVSVEDFPKARKPSYILKVDFWEEIGIKQSSSQLVALYTKEELLGKQILWVVNFPKKQIANFFSECLVTGLVGENGEVTLAVPDKKVENGMKLL